MPGRGADEDETAPLALLAHPDGGGSGTGEGGAEVGGDDGVEVVVGHLPQHPVTQDACVGDHDVETAEGVDRAGHEAVRGLGGADCDGLGDGPAARLDDRLGGPFGDLGVQIVDDDTGTGRCEGGGVGKAEAASTAGDDGDLASEVQGEFSTHGEGS